MTTFKLKINAYPAFNVILHCLVVLISRTIYNQLEQAVQYTCRLYQAKRDGTPNEPVFLFKGVNAKNERGYRLTAINN